MNALQRFPAPSAGADSRSAPSYVGPTAAQVHQNILPALNGRARVRGGLVQRSASTAEATLPNGGNRSGYMAVSNVVTVSLNNVHPNGYRVSHYNNANNDPIVYTDYTEANSYAPVSRSCLVNGKAYAVVHDLAASPTYPLVEWTGSSWTIISGANLPAASLRVVEEFGGRLFALDATGQYLYWTVPLGPTAHTIADWQDPVSGLTNQIKLPEAGFQAICRMGQTVLLFSLTSIYMLSGLTPATFTVRKVSSTGMLGVSPLGVMAYDDAAMFVGPDGLMLFDGATLRNLSTPVWPEIRSALSARDSWSLCRLNHDYVMLCYAGETGTAPIAPAQAWIVHVPTGTWTRFASNIDTPYTSVFRFVGNTAEGVPFGVGRTSVWRLDNLVESLDPLQLFGLDQGRQPLTAGFAYTIDAHWTTRLTELASPIEKAHLQRIHLDYRLSGADAAHWHWNVVARDGSPTTLSTASVSGTGATSVERQRDNRDFFAETSDLQLAVNLACDDPSAYHALDAPPEVYDINVEFRPAQQR